jgi:SAM-dependent methyltransferase
MAEGIYARKPIRLHGTVPVFSDPTEYIENYEKISQTHLASFSKDGTNPFIPEDLWVECERSTVALVRKYCNPGDRVLDVGVGLGRTLSHFPELKRYGMDISLGYLDIACSKGIDVCYALIEDMPYRTEVFDVVVCTDVLEHVLDLGACCSNILSVLKKDGFLITRVPFKEDLSAYSDPGYPYKYAHLRSFDERSLRLLFEGAFRCEFVKMVLTGYAPRPSRLRYQFKFPKRDTLLIRSFLMMKRFHAPCRQWVLKKLFYPVEINMVLKKRP